MFGRRRNQAPTTPPAPKHRADPMAQLEELRRQLRLEDQARFDAIGLPRYLEDPRSSLQ